MVKNRFYSHIKKHYDIEKNELKPGSKKHQKKFLGKRRIEAFNSFESKVRGKKGGSKKDGQWKKSKREISKKKFL